MLRALLNPSTPWLVVAYFVAGSACIVAGVRAWLRAAEEDAKTRALRIVNEIEPINMAQLQRIANRAVTRSEAVDTTRGFHEVTTHRRK